MNDDECGRTTVSRTWPNQPRLRQIKKRTIRPMRFIDLNIPPAGVLCANPSCRCRGPRRSSAGMEALPDCASKPASNLRRGSIDEVLKGAKHAGGAAIMLRT
jgi:hypothetical protein